MALPYGIGWAKIALEVRSESFWRPFFRLRRYGSAILETNLFPTTEFWSASQEQDTLKMDSMLIVRMKLLPAANFRRTSSWWEWFWGKSKGGGAPGRISREKSLCIFLMSSFNLPCQPRMSDLCTLRERAQAVTRLADHHAQWSGQSWWFDLI